VESHISSDGTAHAPFFLSVSQTSAVTEATKVLQAEFNVFERGLTLLDLYKVSLTATAPCRLQLFSVRDFIYQVICFLKQLTSLHSLQTRTPQFKSPLV
jgi:hypothetical protein